MINMYDVLSQLLPERIQCDYTTFSDLQDMTALSLWDQTNVIFLDG